MFTKVTFSFHFDQIFIVFSYETDICLFSLLDGVEDSRIQTPDTFTFFSHLQTPQRIYSMLNPSVYIRGFGLMNMNIYNNRADISVYAFNG